MPDSRSTTIRLDDEGDLTHGSDNPYAWLREVLPLFSDGPAEIEISRPTRSLDQNAFYWGVVLPAVHDGFHAAGIDELHLIGPGGETIDLPVTVNLLHRWFKRKYLTPEEPGEEPSTRNLDTTEFSRYIEAIKNDATVRKLEIEIPSPNRPPIDAYS